MPRFQNSESLSGDDSGRRGQEIRLIPASAQQTETNVWNVLAGPGLGIVLVLVLVAGCGRPATEFAVSERTSRLAPPAVEAIDTTLTENFGTPQQLVAWMKLPIKFGQLEGTVEGTEATNPAYRLAVRFHAATDALSAVKAGSLDDAGLVWLSVRNRGRAAKIANFDAAQNRLSLKVGTMTAPAPGDRFQVVGHFLRLGRDTYMRHCSACHGVNGNGNGPSAHYMNPRPRDFRLGVFKYTSTRPMEKATRDDLKRTLKKGMPGAYMPSFELLTEEELEATVEYVRWLAMRGELERRLTTEFEAEYSREAVQQRIAGGETEEAIQQQLATFIRNDYPELVGEWSSEIAEAWRRAEGTSVRVTPTRPRTPDGPQSRRRGRELFRASDKRVLDLVRHQPPIAETGLVRRLGQPDPAPQSDQRDIPRRPASHRRLSPHCGGHQRNAHATGRRLDRQGDLGFSQLRFVPARDAARRPSLNDDRYAPIRNLSAGRHDVRRGVAADRDRRRRHHL